MLLSFMGLRRTNVARCEQSYHKIDSWSPTDWACAMAGEAGEVCNVVKKIRRLDNGEAPYNRSTLKELNAQVADELADVVIYVDLLAARLGIDLANAVVGKFNKTSEMVGSPLRLRNDDDMSELIAISGAVMPTKLSFPEGDLEIKPGQVFTLPPIEIPNEICAERKRQDEQWGGPAHDDAHEPTKFFEFIADQIEKVGHGLLKQGMEYSTAPDMRQRYVKIAALAIAALESLDRRAEQQSVAASQPQ